MVESHIRQAQAPIVRLLTLAMKEKVLRTVPLPSLMYILTSSSQMIFALGAEATHLYGINVADPAFIDAHAEAVSSMFLLPTDAQIVKPIRRKAASRG